MSINSDALLREHVQAMRPEPIKKRSTSLQSFYSSNPDSSATESEEELALLVDYPEEKGMHRMRGRFNSDSNAVSKNFRKKVKKIAAKESRVGSKNGPILSDNEDNEIEVARGAPSTYASRKSKDLDQLIETEKGRRETQTNSNIELTMNHLNDVRMKVFAARTAMQLEPKLVDKTKTILEAKKSILPNTSSPGAFSLYSAYRLAASPKSNLATTMTNDRKLTKEAMENLIRNSYTNTELTQELLFSAKFDTKWKNRYTQIYLRRDETGNRPKKPLNLQGWVLPLKAICEKFGINPSFFTDHRIDLVSARNQVLLMRLLSRDQTSTWISSIHPNAVKNEQLSNFMIAHFDANTLIKRVQAFKANIVADKDRVREAGQFYNNIRIGKRMFGAARKAKFMSTIVGGMERRFEILENSVNHIPFTHVSSDANKDKMRNRRVHCKDSTRVSLLFPNNMGLNDFIHANRVSGGPLFNEFIITQSPMENTIDDFWRMIWQEEVPYIIMLGSRKDDKCARYWPRTPSDKTIHVSGGVRVENYGVYQAPDPLFRVTHIRLIGPNREERHVEHWQGDLNNSANMYSPLNVLRLLRNTSKPVVIHDHLGISRAACLVAAEIAICSLIRGPTYKYPVQRAIQFLRQHRVFSIETPMQYIYVHRVVAFFFRDIIGNMKEFDVDYERWLRERSKRMFLDEIDSPIPGYRLLSPKADPDLVRMVRRPERPNYRREAPDCVGEMPGKMTTADGILTPPKKIFEF